MNQTNIIRAFDAAARTYDSAASVQEKIAKELVNWSLGSAANPKSILDLGCGTGFVAHQIIQQWPEAVITAVDASPAMLDEVRRKAPKLITHMSDIGELNLSERFDAIYSSMALHWLPDPLRQIKRWRHWLNPKGKIFAALPVEESFVEWKNLCLKHDVGHGLWSLPKSSFAAQVAKRDYRLKLTQRYASPLDFIKSLQATGASTPRQGHVPTSAAKMRKLLRYENRSFDLTYQILFLEISESDP